MNLWIEKHINRTFQKKIYPHRMLKHAKLFEKIKTLKKWSRYEQ